MAQENQVFEIKTQPREATLMDTMSPDMVEKFVMGTATLGQLYGMTIEEAYSIAELGYTFMEQGRLREAQTVFQGLVLSNPYDPYFHTILGSVYQRMELIDGALEEYSIAISLDPANLAAYVNRGELLIRKANFEQAAKDFKSAIDLDPDGTNASANRARALAGITAAALKSAISSAK
jgi:tetratricopeptide (TPR) repeat protein